MSRAPDSTRFTVRPNLQGPSAESSWRVVYQRGPVAQLPDEHASRRDRFAELDDLQPGWQVELRNRGEGGAIDAIFYSPAGEPVCCPFNILSLLI